MASLDFIDSAAQAYIFVWKNRKILIIKALPVIFLKILCILMILAYLDPGNPMREGLFLMPAYVFEAFFLVNVLRFYLYQEPIWIYLPQRVNFKRDEMPPASAERSRAVQSGVCLYLLIKVVLGMIVGVLMLIIPQDQAQMIGAPSFAKAMLSLAVLGILFWSVRLVWVFVPPVMGITFRVYMLKLEGFGNSLFFIGIFIICLVPVMFLYTGLSNVSEVAFGAENILHSLVTTLLQSVAILIALCLQTIAVAHGIRALFSGPVKTDHNK